jgi:hypothetical protein
MLAALTLLSPAAGLVVLAVALPLAAFFVAERRVEQVRSALHLPAPRGGVDVPHAALLGVAVLLLGIACAQPALTSVTKQRVRTDAEVLYVVDNSASMGASSGPKGRTRLERAKAFARSVRRETPELPGGVASLTDRVLPHLLPVPDASAFDATLGGAIAIDDPPPRELNIRATNFNALSAVPRAGYFDPATTARAVVLLTDGESSFFDAATIAHALAARPAVRLIAVQFWKRDEAIYDLAGKADANYRTDPQSTSQLRGLVTAAGGRLVAETDPGAAGEALRSLLGTGPARSVGLTETIHPLAPYLAALALLPLALVFRRRALLSAAAA